LHRLWDDSHVRERGTVFCGAPQRPH
jgi:hypothetical protein